MKSRLATAFSLVALLGGTGGAIAIGASGSSSSSQGGAASGQYKPGKGCGDRNHTHAKNGQCKLKHNCGRHGHQLCPSKPKHCYYYTAHNKRHSYECSAGEKANTGLRHGSKKGSKKSHVKAVNVKRSDPGSLTG